MRTEPVFFWSGESVHRGIIILISVDPHVVSIRDLLYVRILRIKRMCTLLVNRLYANIN